MSSVQVSLSVQECWKATQALHIHILILKSRALTTITQRNERDVRKSGIMQQYSGTLGVKSNFRDYPGKSGRVGQVCMMCLHCPNIKCVLYVSKFGVLCTPSFSIPFWVCLTHLEWSTQSA